MAINNILERHPALCAVRLVVYVCMYRTHTVAKHKTEPQHCFPILLKWPLSLRKICSESILIPVGVKSELCSSLLGSPMLSWTPYGTLRLWSLTPRQTQDSSSSEKEASADISTPWLPGLRRPTGNTGGEEKNKLSAFKGRRSQPTDRMLVSQDHDKFLQGELKPPTSKKSETRGRGHQFIFCGTRSHFHVRSLTAYLNVALGSFLSTFRSNWQILGLQSRVFCFWANFICSVFYLSLEQTY